MNASELRAPDTKDGKPVLIRVPGWAQYPWLRAGFSTRLAGESQAYGVGELNLGWTKEDDPASVARNRAAFARAVADSADLSLVTVGQVHSAVVRDLETEPGPLMTTEGKAALEGDGLVSRQPGKLLAILTADCVPVLVADTRTHAVGAFHAGWRGTLGRIVEEGTRLMRERYGTRAEDVVAAIGPCIGACCFEVGQEVRERFVTEFAYGAGLFRAGVAPGSNPCMDLVAANRQQLLDAGVPAGNISDVAECTACTRLQDGRRKFFSYRDEGGVSGRMLSAIGARA